jgi:hypothetical protein
MAEEIEYEALPSNAGLGVNMLAGAMVCIDAIFFSRNIAHGHTRLVSRSTP